MATPNNEIKISNTRESFEAPDLAPEKNQDTPEQKEFINNSASEKVEKVPLVKKFFTKKPDPKHFLAEPQNPVAVKVEKILEENVGEAYAKLSPIAREEFKLKGEQTAKEIAEIISETHFKVKRIFQLIFSWLKMLPGINRFFLEQEAKIKTDQILEILDRK